MAKITTATVPATATTPELHLHQIAQVVPFRLSQKEINRLIAESIVTVFTTQIVRGFFADRPRGLWATVQAVEFDPPDPHKKTPGELRVLIQTAWLEIDIESGGYVHGPITLDDAPPPAPADTEAPDGSKK